MDKTKQNAKYVAMRLCQDWPAVKDPVNGPVNDPFNLAVAKARQLLGHIPSRNAGRLKRQELLEIIELGLRYQGELACRRSALYDSNRHLALLQLKLHLDQKQ